MPGVTVTYIAGTMLQLDQLQGERVTGGYHNDYIAKQASQTVAIGKAQTKVVVQPETKFVDRIKKIYVQGETINNECQSLSTLLTTLLAVLTLAFCVSTTPP